MSETIAVIGVGAMGSAYARNLLGAGYAVRVFDVDADRVSSMEGAGAEAATSPAAAAAGADLVVSSLPTAEVIEAAYLDDDGVLEGAEAGTLLVEMSTTRPSTSERIAAHAADRGIGFVDAPVIGMPPVAEAAELVITVGGSAADFERVEPVLWNLGKAVHHVGGVGDGHRVKLLNNMVLLTEYAITAEAFALADTVDVDREVLFDIVTSGVAGSGVIEAKARKALDGDFDPGDGMAVDKVLKDLKYALDMGYETRFTLPIAAAVKEHYTLAVTAGRGDDDYSVLMRVLEELG